MSSVPLKLATQRVFGTKVPSAMANSGGRQDTVVLLDRKDFLAKLAKAIHPTDS
jgi:hypothetical protein